MNWKGVLVFILLFLLCFILMFFISKRYKGLSEGLYVSLIAVGLCVVFSTEVLSKFKSININSIVIFWGLILSLLLVVIFKLKKPQCNLNILDFLKGRSIFEYFLMFYILFATGFLLFLCFYFPPNNFDSMAYHMQRVLYWIQNSSIDHYPTPTLQQLYSNPLAEFIILQFQLLTNGDFFATSIQWFSMICCVFGVGSIVKLLGGGFKSQLFSAVLLISIPMGILQATTTQNDYVVSLFLVIFVYFTLKFIIVEKNKFNFIMLSLALALSILTKGTAYFCAIPFLLWLCVDLVKQYKLKSLTYLLTCGAIILFINAGHWSRNYELFKNPFYAQSHKVFFANESSSPLLILSSISKNLYLQTLTPFKKLNYISYINTFKFNKLIGVDLNDKRITVQHPMWVFVPKSYQIFEDTISNPLHLILILLTSALILSSRETQLKKYNLAVLFGFVLFCALVRWQPWASRLHLPFFILSCPFIAKAMCDFFDNKLAKFIIALCIICSIPVLLFNVKKPVFISYMYHLPRIAKYFILKPELYKDYTSFSQQIAENIPAGCKNIGIRVGVFYYEYPLWILIKSKVPGARIQDLNIDEESKPKVREFPFKACIY